MCRWEAQVHGQDACPSCSESNHCTSFSTRQKIKQAQPGECEGSSWGGISFQGRHCRRLSLQLCCSAVPGWLQPWGRWSCLGRMETCISAASSTSRAPTSHTGLCITIHNVPCGGHAFSRVERPSASLSRPEPGHGITERFGLEGTFKRHLVQTPCHGQEHLPPDQAAQSPVQPGIEHFQ